MFGWRIPKSAKAVIPDWIKKRALKLGLKKLEKFIVGGIDLDQLDVHLSPCSVHLSNLALDVGFINEKLSGVVPVIVKEGSIGSLLVKIPWGCELEVVVDEVEILFAFRTERSCPSGEKTDDLGQAGNFDVLSEAGKLGGCTMGDVGKSSSAKVHEGVKMVAKIVKWLLSSFHVKVNKLLIAFEPLCLKEDDISAGFHRTLVFRISEMECGTCVSEDANLNSDSSVDGILGSRLTNFVMFHGVVLELLEMGNFESHNCSPCPTGSIFSGSFSEIRSSSSSSRIASGGNDGFSGSLKSSIPWKNGSLDIRKVDADILIDPIELILGPGAIKWLLHAWETYQNLDKDAANVVNYELMDSVYFNSASCFYSSSTSYAPSDRLIPIHCDSLSSLSSLNGQQSITEGQQSIIEGLIPGSHLIHDWVPVSMEQTGEGSSEELDLGASVDQFFECFDGIRSSQSVLGSSGMWNWTSPVFSALTAASSLASGSLNIPSEQQHVQTSLKASVAGFSVILSLQDEEDQIVFGSSARCLVADCKDLFVALQVRPQELSFEGTVRYIEVAEYLCCGNDVMKLNVSENNGNMINQTLQIQHLQTEIQDALPPCSFSEKDHGSDELGLVVASYFPLQNAAKFKLFSTNGVTCCLFSTSFGLSDGSSKGLTSLSLQIPPFVFWVNFYLVTMLFELMKDFGNTVEEKSRMDRSSSTNEKPGPCHGDTGKSPPSAVISSSAENFRCNVFVPNGRVILCFPSTSGKDVGEYLSWNQFVALDIFAPEKQRFQDVRTIEASSVLKRYASRATHSLHVHVSDLKAHLVSASDKNYGSLQQMFTSKEILSISDKAGCFSTVSMLWNAGTLCGPWIAERAKGLFATEQSWDSRKSMGYEFATVTRAKDLEDIHFQIQEDIVLSSAFFVHFNLFPITIDLSGSHYADLHSILDQMVDVLLKNGRDTASIEEASSTSQSSILMECKSLYISISTDIRKDIKASLQTELPGSWHCLKLNVQKLNLLSVSNIGVSTGASFFWLAHGEGKLWGSVSDIAEREFLLISCSRSMRSRGDGEGSNALSSRSVGLDIMHLWDPNSLHDFTFITVRCSTLVAVGGRLDWLDAISSFFVLPSPENGKTIDDGSPKTDLRSSFVLKFVDVGLSYEPYMKDSVVKDLHSTCTPAQHRENNNESHVISLLAAASLTLSNIHAGDSLDNDYVIRVQDLGLLLCLAHDTIGGTYSVDYLYEMGYVKVARVPLVEATFKIDHKNGLLWEVECAKSQIYVETCHDTTSGLIQLAAQLQQLFAPDLEESIVHLQNRWNNVRHVQEKTNSTDEGVDHSHTSSVSAPWVHASGLGADVNTGVSGLMDEICEDAFHLDGNQACQLDSDESDFHFLSDESFSKGPSGLNVASDVCPVEPSKCGSVPLLELDSSQTSFVHNGSSPEFIESYCPSDSQPLSELSPLGQPSHELLTGRQRIYGEGDLGKGGGGWYGDISLSIFEDHILEASTDSNRSLDEKVSSMDSGIFDKFGQATGQIICKNMKVSWKMYGGSDWSDCKNNGDPSRSTCERDVNTCLELSLSGMQFEYDSFPVGGTCASKICLSIQDLYLYDRSKAALWKQILGYYHSKDRPRETTSKAFKLVLESVRPDPLIPLEEYRLRIAFLPMLLHLQQCQLNFLVSLFLGKGSSVDSSGDQLGIPNPSVRNTDFAGCKIVDEALLPYFQKFDIWPILLRLDYQPQDVDLVALRGGKYVELVNLVPWKGVELQLKHVQAVGIYGWGSVCETILGEWLEDISQNQIRKVLKGLPAIRSFVAVGAGATKLVSLPLESYRKDQKVIKGVQRGTIAFLRSLSLEAVGLGVHLAAGAHDILLQAEDLLTHVPPVSMSVQGKIKPNIRCNQPKDAIDGMKKAYQSLSDGLGKSATALVQKPLKKYQHGASAGSALAAAVWAVPAAAIAPISACASAAHYTLLGLRNSLDPEHMKVSLEKYMGSTQSQDGD